MTALDVTTSDKIERLESEIGRLRAALKNIVRTEVLTTVEDIKYYAKAVLGHDYPPQSH
jgi:hypothetical protein